MKIPPPLLSWVPIWCWRMIVFAALSLLVGCGTNNGDFGEVRSTFVRDDMHDWLSNDASAGRQALPSSFRLTDDERALRALLIL